MNRAEFLKHYEAELERGWRGHIDTYDDGIEFDLWVDDEYQLYKDDPEEYFPAGSTY